MKKKRPISVSLFCGVGGMCLGFEQAGFDIVTAVDCDPIHIATYRENFPNCQPICKDIALLTGNELRSQAKIQKQQIDVIFGGPPCNGFSMIGRRKFDDPRNKLLIHFARLIQELNPKYFVVENVEGLLINPMTQILDAFLEEIDKAGFSVITPLQVLNASDFGVPQNRRRVFVLGYAKGNKPLAYPTPKIININNKVTVWEAIGDLPNIDNFEELLSDDIFKGTLNDAQSLYAKKLRGEIYDSSDFSYVRLKEKNFLTGCLRTVHQPEIVKRFAATQPGASEPISRFHRLAKDALCPTLRAGADRLHGSYTAPRPIHPVYPRCISVREGARLHSFPDWFRFHPTKWHGFRQIGNSVPPLLAKQVAEIIRNVLNEDSSK